METLSWIIITYLILMLIMTIILIGFLEAHTRDKKAWLFVLIQPFGFIWFMWEAAAYHIVRRKKYGPSKIRKKYKAKWY